MLGLLTRDAADFAFQADVFDGDDLEATLAQLRELLDTPLHPVEYQTQFHTVRQEMGETTEAYECRVMQLVAKALPLDTSEGQERQAMERFVEGAANPSLKKRLSTKPQESLTETVSLARVTEKLQRAVQKPDAQCWAISQQQPPQRTNPWASRPYRQPVAGHPYTRDGGGWRRWPNTGERSEPNYRQEVNGTSREDEHPDDTNSSELVVPAVCVPSDKMFCVDIHVERYRVKGLVDTGATKSLINSSMLQAVDNPEITSFHGRLCGANGAEIRAIGTVHLRVQLDGVSVGHWFAVAEPLSKGLILGADILKRLRCTIDMENFTTVLLLID
ncbi:unnamed protein product [Echinostoma caproni]|uniref:Peptidase A2 domain-containing protein n=1 Tax=Echinostoma caproni TaxID=27848 RepID=A0A3P8HUE5_9TREM|nr:unnamed protein product [Echinostoma caproni]